MEKEKIIIDCDPGSDDALAIILALYSGKLDLKAVCSVTGNGALDTTTRNGLNILSLCGREDIPLYRGSAVALDQKQPETVSAFGDDGLGGFAHTIASDKKEEDQNAVDFLVEYVNGHPKEITLFAIGPCTNIAHAIRKSPDFAGNLKRLIIMGGAKYTGNMSPVAEYNFWADPMAAHEVLMSGIQDVTMIGLDVTNKIALDGSMREILRMLNTKLSTFVYNITQEGMDENWRSRRKAVSPMHDVLTVAYFLDNSIVKLKPAYIDVVTEGIARGQSIVDIGGHWNENKCNAKYAYDVVFVIINIIAALSDVWKSFIRKVRNSVGVLFVILLFIQTFFYPRGEVIFSFWIFNAKLEGILFALKLGITLMGVGGSLIWFFSVTQEKDFVLALEKSGMSAKASYVVLSTLQMVPVLKKKSQTIMNAQKARGVETEGNLLVRAKVFVPTIIPLVLSSIAGTEERALTLEARGFSSGIKPTHLYDIEKTEADKKAVVIITLLGVLGIAGRVALWLI